MKRIYTLILVLFLQLLCYSQEQQVCSKTYEYLFVDEIPVFEAKETKFKDFIDNNIQLPEKFFADDKVLVSFVIDENGDVDEIKILKSNTLLYNDAIKTVLSSMPTWRPGKLNGKFVRVRLYLELIFKIE